MMNYRSVSFYAVQGDRLWWKIQKIQDSGESRWADVALAPPNCFKTAEKAEKKMRDLAENQLAWIGGG
jgi:hypothetical protein